jgi:hypothetical protein
MGWRLRNLLERVPFARWQMGGDKVRGDPCSKDLPPAGSGCCGGSRSRPRRQKRRCRPETVCRSVQSCRSQQRWRAEPHRNRQCEAEAAKLPREQGPGSAQGLHGGVRKERQLGLHAIELARTAGFLPTPPRLAATQLPSAKARYRAFVPAVVRESCSGAPMQDHSGADPERAYSKIALGCCCPLDVCYTGVTAGFRKAAK